MTSEGGRVSVPGERALTTGHRAARCIPTSVLKRPGTSSEVTPNQMPLLVAGHTIQWGCHSRHLSNEHITRPKALPRARGSHCPAHSRRQALTGRPSSPCVGCVPQCLLGTPPARPTPSLQAGPGWLPSGKT